MVMANPNSIHDVKTVRQLSELGFTCHVLPVDWPDQVLPVKWPDAKVERVVLHQPLPLFSLRRFSRTLSSAWRIRILAKKHQIQNLLILYVEPSGLWSLFSTWWNVRTVLFTYGSDVLIGIPRHFSMGGPLNQVLRHLYRKAFRSAQGIASTSSAQLQSVRRIRGDTNYPVALIRTGIRVKEMENSTPFPRHPDTPTPYVLFPRVMSRLYNHEFCIEAISQLPNELLQMYSFVFIGNDNHHDDKYVAELTWAASQANGARIIFLAYQDQASLWSLYKHSSAVVMTPKSDGTPVSALEAMYFGKPLILGPLPYDQDLFAPPVRILQSWDSRQLADSLAQALTATDPEERVALRERVLQKCDIKVEMQRLAELIAPGFSNDAER